VLYIGGIPSVAHRALALHELPRRVFIRLDV
jgi:hypothetical protein